jgi:hypothetical protein
VIEFQDDRIVLAALDARVVHEVPDQSLRLFEAQTLLPRVCGRDVPTAIR